jgi:RNA polymerase sigma-70 factor (ECF subfamily)
LDSDAFHKLLLAEVDAVYRLACHLSHTRSEADDLVQETYLRALKSAGTFTFVPSHGIRPWLFKILHNVIHTRYVKTNRERAILEEFQRQTPNSDAARSQESSATNSVSDGSPGGNLDCSMPVNWDGIDERLKHAIAELPMSFREVFLLSAVEGLKYREIAEVIDAPLGTVMSRLSRARATLSERLAGLAAELRLGPNGSFAKEREAPPTP